MCSQNRLSSPPALLHLAQLASASLLSMQEFYAKQTQPPRPGSVPHCSKVLVLTLTPSPPRFCYRKLYHHWLQSRDVRIGYYFICNRTTKSSVCHPSMRHEKVLNIKQKYQKDAISCLIHPSCTGPYWSLWIFRRETLALFHLPAILVKLETAVNIRFILVRKKRGIQFSGQISNHLLISCLKFYIFNITLAFILLK